MLILETGYSYDILLIFSFLLLFLFLFYFISYKFLRKILFLFDPEFIHKISFQFLKILFLLPNPFSMWKYFFQIKNDKLSILIVYLFNYYGLQRKYSNPRGTYACSSNNTCFKVYRK